jgi:hypothetical protein
MYKIIAYLTLHRLLLVGLWFSLVALVLITSMAFVAWSTRSDCDSFDAPITNITSNSCTHLEIYSARIHHYASYFQSAHIIIIGAIASLSLIVFKPSLWAMTWSTLESSALSSVRGEELTMTMSAFQSGVDLANSPNLIPSLVYAWKSLIPSLIYAWKSGSLLKYAWKSGSPTFRVAFVLVVSVLSLLSPMAVSPIYRPHTGPFQVKGASIMSGGGVGPAISITFNSSDDVPGGVAAGRALINAGTTLNTTIYPAVFDITVAPFITRDTIRAIWHAQVETVVARNALDCSSTAPTRLSNSSQDLVTLDEAYFSPNQVFNSSIQPSFATQILGHISNDPVITVVYFNSTTTTTPGVVEAQTSVVFLAANGTLEGAQQRITSPELTSRIKFVDVLVCTSTTRLEISMCTIDNGTVSACDFRQPTNLSSKSATGGVEKYISNPTAVAITLAASPVTAYYILGNRLPMLDVKHLLEDINSQTPPPLSFLTTNTVYTPYSIPLTYVTDVLFAQIAQGLVQGMIPAWPTYANQSVFVISVFGASKPVLLFAIVAVSLVSALIATRASTVACHAAEPDVARLMAISRNVQLDPVLEPYSDRDFKIAEEVMDTRVGYGWIESISRRALMIVPQSHGNTKYFSDESENLISHDTVLP